MQEKYSLQKACKQEGLGVDFEFTAPGLPQQKGCIECEVATLFNWVCTMINGRKIDAYLQNGLWAKATNTAMLLENSLLYLNRNLIPFQQSFGKGKRSILSSMQEFGEMLSPPTEMKCAGLN